MHVGKKRSSGISKNDLLELNEKPCVTSDFYMHDGPEPVSAAPTVRFRDVNVYEDEMESVGQVISEHGNGDVPDKTDDSLAPQETDTYSNYEVVWTVMCILSYIFDVGSDIYLAFVYYSDGDIYWFTLTVIFIVVPSLTITVFSFVWYIQDRGHQSYPLIWLPRVVLLFLQLGPLLRYLLQFSNSISNFVVSMKQFLDIDRVHVFCSHRRFVNHLAYQHTLTY